MQACRKCNSHDVHRSRAKSKLEHWRKELTGKRPFRCRACGWRGWGVDPGPAFTKEELDQASRAMASEPPNLAGTALGPTQSIASEINLGALDAVIVAGENPVQEAATSVKARELWRRGQTKP